MRYVANEDYRVDYRTSDVCRSKDRTPSITG
jgi:hypothetical protein